MNELKDVNFYQIKNKFKLTVEIRRVQIDRDAHQHLD